MKGATLADIAEQAGVSQATVSRVLNDRPGVSPTTRQSVLTALDVLGYERPLHLRTTTTGMVGLIVPELVNPIFADHAQVIETALAREGYATVVCTQAPGGMREDDYVAMLQDRQTCGIIVVSGSHADTTADLTTYHRLLEIGLPLVTVNGHNPHLAVPSISDDDAAAMNQAVAHLVGLGHRRIGLVLGPDRYVPVQRKEEAFGAAMRARLGHDGFAPVNHSLYSVDGGAQAAVDLLDSQVTALVCASDLMALGAIRAVRARGLSVPRDVSVVGCDDSALMRFTDPALTTLHQDVDLIGAMAVSALLGQVRGEGVSRGERLVRPELVIRATTAPPPAS